MKNLESHNALRKLSLVIIAVFTLLSATGCTFYGIPYDDNGFSPTAYIKLEQPLNVTVVTFASNRNPGDPKVIGYKLKCDTGDPMTWVTNALAMELQAANFNVTIVDDIANANTDIIITGSVDKFITGAWTGVCDARMTVNVTKNNQQLLKHEYSNYQQPLIITKKKYRVNYEYVLEGLVDQAVPDIIDSLQ